MQRPEDYQTAVVIARSKWRYKNSLISLAIAIGILLTSILIFLITYAIIAYINYHYPKPHVTHPFLHVTPANSRNYHNYLKKLKFLIQAATHPLGSRPKQHHFEFKLSEGNIAYRISNNSYTSQQISKEDYKLFRDNSAKFGIIYCENWKKNTNWQPLRYNCLPTLKVAIPQDMVLDNTPSSNAGINFLLNDEVSHPTLLAASAVMTALFFLFCGILCCCQLTSCGGTAIALLRTKKAKKNNYEHRSFDPTLNAMLATAASANPPRAGHV